MPLNENDLVAFVDESSSPRGPHLQEYLVCAAVLSAEDTEEIRSVLRPLRLPGQTKLHWTNERDSRRRKIVAVLSSLESMQVVVAHRSAPDPKTERYRRKCLEQLYFELGQMEVRDLVLESRRPGQNRKDMEHIVMLQGRGQAQSVRIRHVMGRDEPLLWIPDAVLGALNSAHLGDGQYWETLQDRVVLQRKTPDSL